MNSERFDFSNFVRIGVGPRKSLSPTGCYARALPMPSKDKVPQRLVMTPLEKLASLPDAHSFVKPGTTLAQLQAN